MKKVNRGIGAGPSCRCRGIVASVALVAAFVTWAADTHDYDSYVRLTGSMTVTNTQNGCGWPDADAWNPEGEMTDTGYYLIPSGIKLTHKSMPIVTPEYNTWPGMELAIAGTFEVAALGGRQNAAVTPRLALLPGGKLKLGSAYGTINGDTLDIRGTAADPSLIEYDYSTSNDQTAYYAQLNIAFTGEEDAVVKFRYTGTEENYDVFQRAFRVLGGFTDFFGTVIVDGENTWLRPETTSTTFDIGGTLWVTNGANVYIGTVSPTFGSLVLASDATLQIAGGKTVTITNSLSLSEGAKIKVNSVVGTSFVYDNGSNEPPVFPVLSVCGADNAAAVDRDALLAAVKAGGLFKNSPYVGVRRLILIETVREDGGVDFKVSHSVHVEQTKASSAGKGPYGFGHYEGYLSDNQAIDPEKDYYNQGLTMFFDSPYRFPGRSLNVYYSAKSTKLIGLYQDDDIEIPDLHIFSVAGNNAMIRHMKKNHSSRLRGSMTLYGSVNFRMSGSRMCHLESSLRGEGDLVETLDIFKVKNEDSACMGNLSLEGDNTAYSGRILVGCGRTPVNDDEGFTNLTLIVSSGMNLGGPIGKFTFDAVKISDTCELSITDTATFDAANRGWCLMDGSAVDIAAEKTATMNGTVTFGGTSEKTGEGTLILGGGTKFYDAENDAATDTANGATFRVAAGGLGVTSSSALAGVNLAFADGTRLVLPADPGCLTLPAAPAIEGDALPVELEIPEGAVAETLDILSLPEDVQFDSGKLAFTGKPGYRICPVTVRTEDGKTIYSVRYHKIGFIISLH